MTALAGCAAASHGAMTSRQRPGGRGAPRRVEFIRDIPLGIRNDICRMLDISPAWINLGKWKYVFCETTTESGWSLLTRLSKKIERGAITVVV